jgi:histidinol-phosphate aminotransferase
MIAWVQVLRPAVVDVGAYSPGVSAAEIKARYGIADVVRLNWNESLFGPLPGVLEATAAELEYAWAYPEESYDAFRAAAAAFAGAAPAQVIPGHGIQALTLAIVAAFVEPGDAVVVPRPTYGLYAQACRTAGAIVHRVDSPGLAFDLEAVAAAAREHRAKLVWICDPNNPTGLTLTQSAWSVFLDALPPGCVAVADEAYSDYLAPGARTDRVSDVRLGRPVIVLRTFSKIFGLAGLRLGYAIVPEALAAYLHTVQEPFNVNRAALAAGLASLRRRELLSERRAQVQEARDALTEPLRAAGISCLPSEANFVLLELGGDDVEATATLARRGLLVRPGSELGLPGHLRVTTAAPEVMAEVAAQLIEVAGR